MKTLNGLEQVKVAAKRYLHLDDDNVIDVVISVYVGNQLGMEPLWLFLVGPPSTAKTELVTSLGKHPDVKLLSSVTPNTFISGRTSPEKADYSLLPELDGKLLAIKDFTSIMSLRYDDRTEIFAQLREIYDGMYFKAYGTGKRIDWRGKVGIIAGVTNAIDNYLQVNQLLGERFLYYRIHTESYDSMAHQALKHVLKGNPNKDLFQQAMQAFLSRFAGNEFPSNIAEDEELDKRLAALATFCTHARTSVSRDRSKKILKTLPEPEGPARLAKQLKLFALALAIVRGQVRVDQAVYNTVRKAALDGVPPLRLQVLRTLWDLYVKNDGDWFRTREIANRTRPSYQTVKLELENLSLLNLVMKRVENGTKTAAHLWMPSRQMWEWVLAGNILA